MNDAFPVPVEFLSLEYPGKIEMHASCGTPSLIVFLRERMKKAARAAKRRFCGVGGKNKYFENYLRNRLNRNCVSKRWILMFLEYTKEIR